MLIEPCSDFGGYRKFGYKRWDGKYHLGHDYNAPAGTKIKAVTDGKIIFSGLVRRFGSNGKSGGVVCVDHGNFVALYGHITNMLTVNQPVKAGDIIGDLIEYQYFDKKLNRSVRADHLHFGISEGVRLPDYPWGYDVNVQGWENPKIFLGVL